MVDGARVAGEAGGPAVVFVSYSREDARWRERFVQMLKPVVLEGRLEVWSDERVLVGDQWRPQLAGAIARARAGLLLVSGSFLASEFIMRRELPALLDRGIPLVCVLVSDCMWRHVPALERLQWAHDPQRDGPLDRKPVPARNRQIVQVCAHLLERLAPAVDGDRDGDARAGAAARPADPRAGAPAATITAGARAGELHGVPLLPGAFVAREELDGLRAAVLRDAAVGVTGKRLGLHGQGGIGKTVLAAAVARDESIRRHFPDGVFWVTVGEAGDVLALQLELLARLDETAGDTRSVSGALRLLRAALAERQCLLVVDDVWSLGAAQAFAAAGPRGRVLYTSRDAGVLRAAGAEVRQVDVLPPAAARALLAGLTQTPVDQLPGEEVDRVLGATGRVALALALIGRRGWQRPAHLAHGG